MLANLSDLLRESLRRDGDGKSGGSAHELPLREELALLDRYLAIMRARFGARLTIDVDIEPAAADALVPRFILQPLVENALQHGAARHAGAARVSVRAAVTGDGLELVVENDGPVAAESRIKRKEGVGLSNTRRRLSALYGDGARLDAEPLPAGGFRARLVVPVRGRPGTARTSEHASGEDPFDDAAVG
jgi:LytS/YehU family sensor histidine kinase